MKSKTVLITGSSVGIGRETALLLSKEFNVIITYNKGKKNAEETANKCKENGAETLVLKLDVTKDSDVKNAVKKSVSKFGKIDILINNAGVIFWKHLEDQTGKEIESQIRVNLEGLIKMTKEALPHVTETIINISSGAGKAGYEDLTTYCATKFGVRGFTQALAEETSLNVYSVNPGLTQTRMTNFKGVPAQEVAKVVANAAKGGYRVKSGGDIDVWKHISPTLWKKYMSG